MLVNQDPLKLMTRMCMSHIQDLHLCWDWFYSIVVPNHDSEW